MSIHPHSVALEQFAVEDLPKETSAEISTHVSSCPQCQGFLAELAEANSTGLQTVPPEQILKAVAGARQRRLRIARWIQYGFAGALAALLLLLVLPRSTESLRLKGVGLAVHRKRGDVVQMLDSDTTVRAGDALRLVVTLSKPTSIAVWSVDARGRIDRLTPPGGIAFRSGENVLPGSAVVESPCVELWLFLLAGPQPDDQLASAFRRAQEKGITVGEDWAPSGALVKSFRCEN